MPRWLSLAERLTCNQLVEGSNPSRGSPHLSKSYPNLYRGRVREELQKERTMEKNQKELRNSSKEVFQKLIDTSRMHKIIKEHSLIVTKMIRIQTKMLRSGTRI